MKTIGKNIAYYRTLNGLTQKELEARLGVAPKYISNIEEGYKGISLEKLIELSIVLGISVSDLLPVEERHYMDEKEKWIGEITNALREWEPTRVGFLKTMVCSTSSQSAAW
jgi:transcriptional regulator with XRE-family HTH domain